MDKLKPTSLNISLGNIEAAQPRRKAYEKAALAEGVTLGSWARKNLDHAASYKEDKKFIERD